MEFGFDVVDSGAAEGAQVFAAAGEHAQGDDGHGWKEGVRGVERQELTLTPQRRTRTSRIVSKQP
jgi:hypothetical protein